MELVLGSGQGRVITQFAKVFAKVQSFPKPKWTGFLRSLANYRDIINQMLVYYDKNGFLRTNYGFRGARL